MPCVQIPATKAHIRLLLLPTLNRYLSGAFLLLCFLDHFLVATILRRSYEYYLRHAQNPYRWIEYFASSVSEGWHGCRHTKYLMLSTHFIF